MNAEQIIIEASSLPLEQRKGYSDTAVIGGLAAFVPRWEQAALMMLDGLQPEGIVRLAVDSMRMLPQLGILATVNPEAAAAFFDRGCLIRLGTAVCPTGRTSGSMARILFIRASETTTPPSGTPPPTSPVLPPWGTTGSPAWAQMRTTAATSSVEPGRTTAAQAPWKRPRSSARWAARAPGSSTQPRAPTASRSAERTNGDAGAAGPALRMLMSPET